MRSVLRGLVLLALGLAALGVLGLWVGRSWGRLFPRTRVDLRQTLKVLRSQELAFLVTDRIVTQVVVEQRESNPWLGSSERFLVGVVRYYFGVDLASLKGDALRREGDAVVVTLPEPRELDLGVDMESVRVISKRSGLIAIRDWAAGTDHDQELRSEFAAAARRFLKHEGLIPSRESLVRRLQSFAPALSARAGVRIVFR